MRRLVVLLLMVPACASASATPPAYATGLEHVSALAFDTRGRLWAATADYADSGDDAVYVVTNLGATPQRVIDGVHTPLGLLWIDDTLYVSSQGGVVAHRGFDGTAFASNDTIVALPDDVGEVNGLALGDDGRIRLGISSPCDHCTPTNELSAAVVSFRPDGSDLRVDASGIRAAIGLAYDGDGNLLATENQRDDRDDPDTLAIVGGKVVAELDPHAAVSGVAVIGTHAYVAEWATGKVVDVDLDTGATTTVDTSFENPVPVVATDDGAILVGDWTTGVIRQVAVG